MNLNATSFINALDAKNLKYDVEEGDGHTLVSISTGAENMTSIRVNLFIDDDNSHVSLCVIGFIRVKPENFANALIACNSCNQKYRWVKFVIDDDMDINAMDDAVTNPDSAGEELFELMVRMMQVVDDSYPVFMKSLWDS